MSDIEQALTFVGEQIDFCEALGEGADILRQWRRIEVLLMKLRRLEVGHVPASSGPGS